MQLVLATMIAGACVSKTTYLVLCRVDTANRSSAAPDWASFGNSSGPSDRCATHELASLIGLDPSRIDLKLTPNREVHCSIQGDPDDLLRVTTAAEAAIDRSFRERHVWTGLRVVLRVETSPTANGWPATGH